MKNHSGQGVIHVDGAGHALSSPEDAHSMYQLLACTAAALERSGDYGQAAEAWGICLTLAPDVRNRFWCEVRQARCQKQVIVPASWRSRKAGG
ncbi:hypothetical protein D3C81_1718560 [compost metagenome]|uniref:ANR family transcriptional regulator n=1 Tax=Serratia quinivorans TaxID=137545 RepID=UPI000FAC0586|nr:ANR family transcriptional regulator [Serratia quinivorans]CAI1215348.1 Uncharacterised protein [Serratia quinivorans]CAI1855951.1 Uncharacterised protein [Serratia quinivorans]CAI1965934.1 Uncharacterised protein [Serratia quinivorans]CAI1967371.1 Uncharacterised protein [Serratia quinivorans]CAI2160860.1 Uncharacterised protein [Serratia quinivorans]